MTKRHFSTYSSCLSSVLYSEALKNSPRSTKADSDQNNSIDL
nr:MAG TPA: hypothetical protein [Caudoviricetes sp.]